MERRLTSILTADVVGYSRLMGEDETGTLAALKAHRTELIDPKAAQYGGRIIKLMGDGVLMEFASIVDAVSFAVDVQHAMQTRNAGVPEDRQILYRVGINIGDVVVEDNDIYGDGVNVASRLEGLSNAGGVCIAGNVREQIQDKLKLNLEDLGDVEVKNIARPVRAFRIVMDDKASALSTPVSQAEIQSRYPARAASAAVLTLILVAGGALLWWRPWAPEFEPARIEAMTLPLPDKPSIVVLPFKNISGDPGQDYFADGITEDLITDLSKISELFVIARKSSYVYKDRRVKLRQVAEELGVRYVLEGSVRRANDEVRINAQLIDATMGGQIWADRYDGSLGDVFALQDKVTQEIIMSLAANLTQIEQAQRGAKDTAVPEAYDAYLRGWDHYLRFTREDLGKARPFLEQAVDLDPNYGRAYAALARVFSTAWNRGWYVELGWKDVRCKAEGNVRRALRNPTPLAHLAAADKRLTDQLYDEAVGHIEKGLALNPNDADLIAFKGWVMTMAGRPDEALAAAQQALRLDPGDLARKKWIAGIALFTLERYEEALAAFEIAQKSNPQISGWPQVASLMHLGRTDDAKAALLSYLNTRGVSDASNVSDAFRDIRKLPWGTIGKFLNFYPFKRPEDAARFAEPLVSLGMCCQEEIDDRLARLRRDGHARSENTTLHLQSLRSGRIEACLSGN